MDTAIEGEMITLSNPYSCGFTATECLFNFGQYKVRLFVVEDLHIAPNCLSLG
jgi:hypothetical protein